MTTNRLAQVAAAYRKNPGEAEIEALRGAMRGLGLLVPVGNSDGHNAELALIRSKGGRAFIPLFASRDQLPAGVGAEEIAPADWLHILDQLDSVAGFVVDPYGDTNLAFGRRFIESLLAEPHAGAQPAGRAGAADGPESGAGDGDSVLAAPDVPEGTTIRVGEPATVPETLRKAAQAVADEVSVPLWLLLAVPTEGTESYLMVADVSDEWFAAGGTERINRVLERFPAPGLPLDFVAKSNELGAFVGDLEPHYVPAAKKTGTETGASGPQEVQAEATGEAGSEPEKAAEPVAEPEAGAKAKETGEPEAGGTAEPVAVSDSVAEKAGEPAGAKAKEVAEPEASATVEVAEPRADKAGKTEAEAAVSRDSGRVAAAVPEVLFEAETVVSRPRRAVSGPKAGKGGKPEPERSVEPTAAKPGSAPVAPAEEPVVSFDAPVGENPDAVPDAFAPRTKGADGAEQEKDAGGKRLDKRLFGRK